MIVQDSEVDATLENLRDRANEEHRLTLEAAKDMITHAITAGEILNEIRERIPWGEWMEWVEREFSGSVSNANFYRRLALNASLVRTSGVRTLREAERYLVEHAALTTSTPRTGSIVKERRREIITLRQAGKPVEEVAAIVGVSVPTVYNLSRKDWQRRNRRHNLIQKQARQALKREQRERQAKKIGGNLGEAYSLLRRTAQVLQNALDQATTKPEREHLGRALDRLHKSEDELGQAIREVVVNT